MRSIRDISAERRRLAELRNRQRDVFDRGYARGAEVALDWVLQRISNPPSSTFEPPDAERERAALEAALDEIESGSHGVGR